eukprot:CAMPEP_0178585012 /NCGR_PEP_ID=MMETSP0697-20121206/25166_1 /TAXON_ID=265572 /ORGANISM="Extubocellulus spinifer, Strain CCMP396" /LENGTH=45 /DNA_ID= /DNA_START= /DNA_END= /DNA_ORIENTATION=
MSGQIHATNPEATAVQPTPLGTELGDAARYVGPVLSEVSGLDDGG